MKIEITNKPEYSIVRINLNEDEIVAIIKQHFVTIHGDKQVKLTFTHATASYDRVATSELQLEIETREEGEY